MPKAETAAAALPGRPAAAHPAPASPRDLDTCTEVGSLQALQSTLEVQPEPISAMPKAEELDVPLVGTQGSIQGEKWWYEENRDQGLQRMGWGGKRLDADQACPIIFAPGAGLFGGLIDDYRRRMPNYGKDISQAFSRKTLSSALFMFFATFFSTASLGAKIQKDSNHRIGLEEYLLMNSIAGMTHALLGCQPLLVLRPTGPITLIVTQLVMLSDEDWMDLQFNQYLGATGFFVGLYMMIIASTEFCRMIKYLTRFTHDIFAFFVCSIYIVDGITGVLQDCTDPTEKQFGISLFSALLAILVFAGSMWLNFAITWKAFNKTVRDLLTDYAVTISVFAVIGLSYAWKIEERDVRTCSTFVPSHLVPRNTDARAWAQVPRIEVPSAFAPTCRHDLAHNTSFMSFKYDCVCNSHPHCTYVNSVDDNDPGMANGVNGTAISRPWLVVRTPPLKPPPAAAASLRGCCLVADLAHRHC